MTLLLREADQATARVRGMASSPAAEAHLNKRAWLVRPRELGRVAEPI